MYNNSLPKLTTISIENLRLRAYIGFLDWEKRKLQDVIISISFKYNASQAVITDDVAHAIDYKPLKKQIVTLVDQQQFNLIDYLAEKIYETVRDYHPSIESIEVKLEKPHALRFADNVFVKLFDADRYKTAMIALGSNINAEENFAKALDALEHLGFISQRTEFVRTKALKFTEQDDFLNAAILLETKKSLTELQMALKHIEARQGRIRTENKNAPRTIDVDVITYNGFLIDEEINELPFLLDFLKELQPTTAAKLLGS